MHTCDVYIYQADIYCSDCARKIMDRLTPPDDPLDEESFDSDDYPKGPYSDGGGEADCAQHCAGCYIFLGNPLTAEGCEHVIAALEREADDLEEANRIMPLAGSGEAGPDFAYWHGKPHKAIVLEWAEALPDYGLNIGQIRRLKFAKAALETGPMAEAQFERFALSMPLEASRDCSHSGQCDADVEHWAGKIPRPAEITPEALRAELKEYGAWDEQELADDAANWRRLIWSAANNIAEELSQ